MFKPKWNSIADQKKGMYDKITSQEWNFIINVLKEQINNTTSGLVDLEKLLGTEEFTKKLEEIGIDVENFKKYALSEISRTATVYVGEEEPQNQNVAIWIRPAVEGSDEDDGDEEPPPQPVVSYRVRFYNWDNTLINEQFVVEGEDAILPTNPVRASDNYYHYTFDGWDGLWQNITMAQDVYAYFLSSDRLYKVTFKNYNAITLETQETTYGGNVQFSLSDPTKPDDEIYYYRFKGWSGPTSYVTTNIVVYATYESILKPTEDDPEESGYNPIVLNTSVQGFKSDDYLHRGIQKLSLGVLATGQVKQKTFHIAQNTILPLVLENRFRENKAYQYTFHTAEPIVCGLNIQSIAHGEDYEYTILEATSNAAHVSMNVTPSSLGIKSTDHIMAGNIVIECGMICDSEGYIPTHLSGTANIPIVFSGNTSREDFESITNIISKNTILNIQISNSDVDVIKSTDFISNGHQSNLNLISSIYGYQMTTFEGQNIFIPPMQLSIEASGIQSTNLTGTPINIGMGISIEPLQIERTIEIISSNQSVIILNSTLVENGDVLEKTFLIGSASCDIGQNLSISPGEIENKWVVNFYDWDGTLLKSQEVFEGTNANPPSVSREGYNFSYWSINYNNVLQNIDTYAIYVIKKFIVSISYYSGTTFYSNQTQEVVWGGTVTLPNNYQRTNYDFISWVVDPLGLYPENATSFTNVTQAFSITAQYNIVHYYVYFYSQPSNVTGQTPTETQYVPYEGWADNPSFTPTKTGYYFQGWDKSWSYVVSTLHIYPIFKLRVLLSYYEGTTSKTDTLYIDYGGSVSAPTNYTRTGYDFVSWSASLSNITSSKTITANYTIKKFNVRFFDCQANQIGSTIIVDYGGSVVGPTWTVNTGYTFNNWDTDTSYFSNITQHLDFYAECSLITYYVSFYNYKGFDISNFIITKSTTYQGSVTPPTPPERTGYTFTGWVDGQGNIVDLNNITQTQDVFQEYTPISYSVIWKDYNGTTIQTLWYDYGTWVNAADWPENPSRNGYVFDGWVVSPVGADIGEITQDITITATYVLATPTYTVKFFTWEGSELLNYRQTVEEGSAASPPPNPTRSGWYFIEWSENYGFVTSNLNIYPIFKLRVIVSYYEGTTAKTATHYINSGGSVPAPSNYQRTGYTFLNWSASLTNITSSKTITANYGANPSINYYNYNGDWMESIQYSYGANVTPPSASSRTGFTFDGWTTTLNGSTYTTFTNVTSSRNAYQKYSIISYTITALNWNDTVFATQSVAHGGRASPIETPTRTGYTFSYWNVITVGGNLTNVDRDITVKAIYTANSYTMSYDGNGGTSPSSKSVTYGNTYGTLGTSTRTSYTFNGWFTAPSGGTRVTSSTTVTKAYDHTIYAQWTYAGASVKIWEALSNPPSSYDETKSYIGDSSNCPTNPSSVLPDPSGYNVDYIIRVRHLTIDMAMCAYTFFKVVLQ